jgi:hypothetical protein
MGGDRAIKSQAQARIKPQGTHQAESPTLKAD